MSEFLIHGSTLAQSVHAHAFSGRVDFAAQASERFQKNSKRAIGPITQEYPKTSVTNKESMT